MPFCTNCGYEMYEGAKFCAECGTPINKDIFDGKQKSDNNQKNPYSLQEMKIFRIIDCPK